MGEKNIEMLISNGVDVEKSLELFGDIDTYNETIGELLTAINKKIPQLEEYMNVGDMNNYAILVHSLKSDARYFGFSQLGEIAFQHEMKSKENNSSYINMNFEQLKAEAEKARSLIEQYLGNSASVSTETTPSTRSYDITDTDVIAPLYTDKVFLVADDSNIVRTFVEKTFDDDHVKVLEDGKEVIETIKNNENMITGLLLDLNMPNVNGFEVLDYFKEHNLFKKIPTSIITGESARETMEKAYKYNIVDILTKPFSEEDLKRVVEKTKNIVNWT